MLRSFAIPNDPNAQDVNAAIRELTKIRSKLQVMVIPVTPKKSTKKISCDIRELVAKRVELEKNYAPIPQDPKDKELKTAIRNLKKFRPITKKITAAINELEAQRSKLAEMSIVPATPQVVELNSQIRKLVKIRTELEFDEPFNYKKRPMKDLAIIDNYIRNLELIT